MLAYPPYSVDEVWVCGWAWVVRTKTSLSEMVKLVNKWEKSAHNA